MSVKIIYSDNATETLEKLEDSVAQKIYEKIRFYTEQANPLQHAQKLKSPYEDLYRYRIGDYRVIFEIDAKGNITLLTILKIGHRKDIYK